MNFSEQPPSTHWAVLKYKGHAIAEVWFKPDGDDHALTLRIPQASFQNPLLAQQLTAEHLLRAVGVAPAEVESWRADDISHSGAGGDNSEFKNPIPPPPPDATHLDIHFRIAPPQAAAGEDSAAPEISAAKWQDLEARWKVILGLEATVDTLRISMESLRSEIEAASSRTLSTEQKLHALRADVAQWNAAKNRAHFALPKIREFIHRATWAMGAPERKHLDEIYKSYIRPQIPFPEIDKVLDQLENLQKDRQVLAAHGSATYQECKKVATDIQGAMRNLQSGANAKAHQKKGGTGSKGKFF